ncbi:MAG: GNAT family N-acetyltransferase, partial [Candidatus Obscuribacterales bacterium]|nr:GNAT family N-acetyltransferase [Candidatus Obscuribacterales bacterium]
MSLDRLVVTMEDAPAESDRTALREILRAYNRSQADDLNHKALCILVRDEEGSVVGGLEGDTYWDWLYIERLALSESIRQRGVGSELLLTAEKEAFSRVCRGVFLSTTSFQALPFYEKHGYSVFGVLDNFPPEHKCFFLQKVFGSPDSGQIVSSI